MQQSSSPSTKGVQAGSLCFNPKTTAAPNDPVGSPSGLRYQYADNWGIDQPKRKPSKESKCNRSGLFAIRAHVAAAAGFNT